LKCQLPRSGKRQKHREKRNGRIRHLHAIAMVVVR
jgi:hypothetical protein